MDRKDIVDIKYKFLYLVVLILDAIQTAVIILVVIAALFAFHVVSGLLQFICSASKTHNGQNNSMPITFSSNSTSTDYPCGLAGYHLWLARATLVLIAFIVIMIQWFGWKGYRYFDFKSTIVFATAKGIESVLMLVILCYEFSTIFALNFAMSIFPAIIPVLFGIEVRKFRAEYE